MPEEVAYVGLGHVSISFVKGEIMLEFSSHDPQIVNKVGMRSGVLEAQSVYFFAVKDVVHRIGIVVDHTSVVVID